jgi:hypothetical protein
MTTQLPKPADTQHAGHVMLRETPHGWVLTVTIAEHTLDELREGLCRSSRICCRANRSTSTWWNSSSPTDRR